ncbi:eCIS core domain-containing protein [Natronobiforma cellulositropha]|uniref:eCIS core domain-containing protein n=1 Tax=Natronobiforma cellulositropha TaxID=1679076 RepID=UPI0021D5F46D|nr:DUF4157 domain-containing protein [Natronobiforma cellulositropha]
MSFGWDRRDRSNDDSEQNERTRRARAQPQTQGGTRPHQYLSSVLQPSPEQAAQLDRLIQTRGFEQVQRWGERGELPEGINTPTGEQVRVARARSRAAGVELDTPSAMRSVEAQAESDLAGETATPDVVRRVITQPGKPLEGSVREEMEQRMGDSFSDVQLHTGPEAAKAASALEARAFTTGNHVVFNRGEYDPESPEGKYLLAHELAHVRQQTGGAISMLPQEGSSLVIDPDPELEREADEVARKALSGEPAEAPVVVNRNGVEMYVQRLEPVTLQYLGAMVADDGTREGAKQLAKQTVGEKAAQTRAVLDEKTTREYRLTRAELEAVVEHGQTGDGLDAFLDEQGIEPTSDFEELVDSDLRWSISIGNSTYTAATLLSLGFAPAAIVALGSGYGAKKVLEEYGEEIGARGRRLLREHAGLSTEDQAEEEGGEFGGQNPFQSDTE